MKHEPKSEYLGILALNSTGDAMQSNIMSNVSLQQLRRLSLFHTNNSIIQSVRKFGAEYEF